MNGLGNAGLALSNGDNGALYAGLTANYGNSYANRERSLGIAFDASRSEAVYTDSGKVYPLSLALNYIIKC